MSRKLTFFFHFDISPTLIRASKITKPDLPPKFVSILSFLQRTEPQAVTKTKILKAVFLAHKTTFCPADA